MYLYTSTQLNLITMKKNYRFFCLTAFNLLFFVGSCKKEAKIAVPIPNKVADNLVNLKK